MTKLAKSSGIAILVLSALTSDGFVLNSRQAHVVTSSSRLNRHVGRPYSFSIDQTQSSNSSDSSDDNTVLSSVGDWSAYLDESKGLIYYFNRRTGESQWEQPSNVVFPEIIISSEKKLEMRVRLKTYLKERLNDSSKDTNMIDAMEKERERAAKKRQEALSKLEALKKIQTNNNIVDDQTTSSNLSTSDSSQEDQRQTQPIDVSKPTSLPQPVDDNKPTSLPIVQQDEWSAYFDIKSGLVFYYNEETKVSLWDPPTKDFPRVVMENNVPKVLDPRMSNISMERALTMSMEEDDAKQKWQEAKEKEKARKAKLRAEKAAAEQKKQQQEDEGGSKAQTKYEATKASELRRLENERIDRDRKVAEAKVLLGKEQLDKDRAVATKAETETTPKQPVRPNTEPDFSVDNVVAPVSTLYDILQCPPTATRVELKRSYLQLAKETHPDALMQAGEDIAPDKFVEIAQAWEILGDSQLRRRYDREIRAKGVSTKAGSMFESFVMGAAKRMDEALSKAEDQFERERQ